MTDNMPTQECFAWDVEFFTTKPNVFLNPHKGPNAYGWHHHRGVLGAEKEVREMARKFARENGVKRWHMKPKPQYNNRFKGKLEITQPFALWRERV